MEDVVDADPTILQNGVARAVRLPIVDCTAGQCEDLEPNVVQNGNAQVITAPIRRRNACHTGNVNGEIACSNRVHRADRGGEPALYTFQEADCSADLTVARSINFSKNSDVIEGGHEGRTESGSQYEWREGEGAHWTTRFCGIVLTKYRRLYRHYYLCMPLRTRRTDAGKEIGAEEVEKLPVGPCALQGLLV